MTIRHQIKDYDTVEHLSNAYFGTPDRWREIVDYNRLIYPYLSSKPEDKYKVYASGFLRVTRSETRQPLTIGKHWAVRTKKNVMSTTSKTYHVIEEVTIPAGESEGLIRIRSIVPGIQGNASEGSVTELGDDFENNSVHVSVTNDAPITGGMEGFIKVTGEYIFIPSKEDTQLLTNYDVAFSYDQIRYFYGEDLKLSFDDDLVFETTEDLGTIGYVDNVKQAVNRRFTTEIGDILSDFSFGNTIASIIGDNNLPFEAKKRLVHLEVLNCLGYDDRISDPVVTNIQVIPSELACYVDVEMKVVKIGSTVTLENIRLGGTS